MALTCGRGAFVGGTSAVFVAANVRLAARAQVAAIEQRDGGHLGVAVLDTGSGWSMTHRIG